MSMMQTAMSCTRKLFEVSLPESDQIGYGTVYRMRGYTKWTLF